jgi:hypothetical protein
MIPFLSQERIEVRVSHLLLFFYWGMSGGQAEGSGKIH